MKVWKLETYNGWHTLYTGLGYNQGMGFDIEYKSFEIYWSGSLKLRIITGIRLEPEREWLNKLKVKLDK